MKLGEVNEKLNYMIRIFIWIKVRIVINIIFEIFIIVYGCVIGVGGIFVNIS